MKFELDSWLEQRYGVKMLLAASACFSEVGGKKEMSLSSIGNANVKVRVVRHMVANVT